jgi:hypothetical protein
MLCFEPLIEVVYLKYFSIIFTKHIYLHACQFLHCLTYRYPLSFFNLLHYFNTIVFVKLLLMSTWEIHGNPFNQPVQRDTGFWTLLNWKQMDSKTHPGLVCFVPGYPNWIVVIWVGNKNRGLTWFNHLEWFNPSNEGYTLWWSNWAMKNRPFWTIGLLYIYMYTHNILKTKVLHCQFRLPRGNAYRYVLSMRI